MLESARACCDRPTIAAALLTIDREFFLLSAAISSKPGERKEVPESTDAMVDRLDGLAERLEAVDGVVRDWTVPGGHRFAAFEVARSACCRAKRNPVRLQSSGESIQRNVLPYLNRLPDMLWLFARVFDHAHGIDARLRDSLTHPGLAWSRAW